jgi:hypothetical protein
MKIVAALSRRYEPDWLVEELHQNLSWCDSIITYDDRGRDPDDLEWNEHQRYTKLHEWVGLDKADYVIMTAPDERWAPNFEEELRESIDRDRGTKFYRVPILEMYTPTTYRVDGRWANLPQVKIYPWREDQEFMDRPLHNLGAPLHDEDEVQFLDVNQYHLKHIEEQNILKRIESFKQIDPDGEYSFDPTGYDYLADTTGLELKEIPEDEMFYPPYTRQYIFNPGGFHGTM